MSINNSKQFITDSNIKYNHWYSLEECNFPFWIPDTFTHEQILVTNKEECSGEGYRLIPTPMKSTDKPVFESRYGDEGETEEVTHFMIPSIGW
ncbi:hypothetical protein AXI64_gp026 [Vibrio phage qdvp001]|uniref:hypothetical protein n=1 Tax=Vibrio phage qdvp001 TaxID=1003177 RepID=UPI0007215FF9|nr:hypothetical protein AXI64_gp026 [Vibrio phage qdvp001]ALM62018.1 hypothetical protein qdvp001_026 [Vibrio phage qdvp001]